jgi:8-oxo-dGTP pyrophosphatase MutT (NUDIX family)
VTSRPEPGPRLLVVGVDHAGAEVARLALGHGDDPNVVLAVAGWDLVRVRDVVRHPVERLVLTMTFVVEPSVAQHQETPPSTNEVEPPWNHDQVSLVSPVSLVSQVGQVGRVVGGGNVGDGEVALRHQRVAAYAVVTSSLGFLMTQFSGRTGAEGQWGLPGGGLEKDEAPDVAVLREVWEESGQVIEVSELALIATSRWVGLAPSGRLEDYHAVRVVYRAVCPEPTETVVHDVGGTTASAAWLLPAELDLLALTSGWRSILREVNRLA